MRLNSLNVLKIINNKTNIVVVLFFYSMILGQKLQ